MLEVRILFGFLAVISAISLLRLFRIPLIRRVIIRMRGVYVPESIMANSPFVPGKIPACQIGVYKAGTFTDTFVGYAIRLANDVITMPLHVAQLTDGEMVLKNENTSDKVYIGKRTIIETNLISDLCYIKVLHTELVNLKIKNAQLPKTKDLEGFVSVTGRSGASSGRIGKHQTKGLLEYLGSTLPGYSGAAYMIGNCVYGMHIGAGGTCNLGITFAVWLLDLPKLFKLEILVEEGSITFSSPSLLGDFEENMLRGEKSGKSWDFSDIAGAANAKLYKGIDKMTVKGGWDDGEVDYDEILQFENAKEISVLDALKQMSVDDLTAFISLAQAQKVYKSKVNIKPQAPGENSEIEVKTDFPSNKITIPLQINLLEGKVLHLDEDVNSLYKFKEDTIDRVLGLEDRISKLEEQARKPAKETQEKKRSGYLCWHDGCLFSSRKVVGLVGHLTSFHKLTEEQLVEVMASDKIIKSYIKPEASDEIDQTQGNGRGNFIRGPFRKPKQRTFKNTLNRMDPQFQFQSSMNNQSSMESFANQFLTCLQSIAKNSNGHTSGMSQS